MLSIPSWHQTDRYFLTCSLPNFHISFLSIVHYLSSRSRKFYQICPYTRTICPIIYFRKKVKITYTVWIALIWYICPNLIGNYPYRMCSSYPVRYILKDCSFYIILYDIPHLIWYCWQLNYNNRGNCEGRYSSSGLKLKGRDPLDYNFFGKARSLLWFLD